MKKFVSYDKMSKKKKREIDAAGRTLWAISPVTRKPENPKAYKRKKTSERDIDPALMSFLEVYPIFSGKR